MPTNIDVPGLGDSVSEAVLLKWLKGDGDFVKKDEVIAELETDKANAEMPSTAAGILKRLKKEGDTVTIGETIATVDPNGTPGTPKTPATAPATPAASSNSGATSVSTAATSTAPGKTTQLDDLSPATRRVVSENNLDPATIKGTGPGGRVTKDDAQKVADKAVPPEARTEKVNPAKPAVKPAVEATKPVVAESVQSAAGGGIRRVPMSKIRKKIAERLVHAQSTAAILTTFNEIDLQAVMDLRTKYKEKFEKTHGIGLGFMSFFAKACCVALKEFERVNAEIDGDEIVYHDYVNLGIAVSTERGLAVPVLRDAHLLSFAQIESEIKRLAMATRDGKLGITEMSGGTFTITNGGVFGSLLSTPIINPPQSGILGMHTIQKRPVVVNDQIVIRPMMYVALSYDHRLVDGKESVSFLVRIKELLEDPSRLLLGV